MRANNVSLTRSSTSPGEEESRACETACSIQHLMPPWRSAPGWHKMLSANGTGAYSMEAPQLRCGHRFRYVARFGSLVAAFLLCLGVFLLPLPASGSVVPSALAMANLPRFDLVTNGNDHPLDGTYLVAPA